MKGILASILRPHGWQLFCKYSDPKMQAIVHMLVVRNISTKVQCGFKTDGELIRAFINLGYPANTISDSKNSNLHDVTVCPGIYGSYCYRHALF